MGPAGAGLGATLGDAAAFFANIEALRADRPHRGRMGRAARGLDLESFDRDRVAAAALEVVAAAAGGDGATRSCAAP